MSIYPYQQHFIKYPPIDTQRHVITLRDGFHHPFSYFITRSIPERHLRQDNLISSINQTLFLTSGFEVPSPCLIKKEDLKLKRKIWGVLIAIKQLILIILLNCLFKAEHMKLQPLNQNSKTNLDPHSESQRKLIYGQDISEYESFLKKQTNLKDNLAFWNGMAQSKLESISSSINLMVLLLIITLASTKYNGPETKGPEVLGWIMIGQVCFFYVLVLIVKFFYIPSIEREIQKYSSQGFKLYKSIEEGKKQIKNLQLSELELLNETVKEKSEMFSRCFPGSNMSKIIQDIKSTLESRSAVLYRLNTQIVEVKKRQRNARWWQTLWQSFVLGKTFTIPGVMLLVLIITPLSIATPLLTSDVNKNGQGWWAVGFWVTGIFIFILIKFVFWDYLNRMAENARSDSFVAYYPVSLKHKELKDLSIPQLEALEHVLDTRGNEFEICFSVNSKEVLANVKGILNELLPNNNSEAEQASIREIILKQKNIQSHKTAWTNFFNLRIVATIINALKFLIVVGITFVQYYPTNADELKYARRVVGGIGVGIFLGGYIFYFIIKGLYLPYLDEKVRRLRSSPFATFRLVYLGNKKLNDLEVHELEDVSDGLKTRKSQFLECFPNVNPETLGRDIQEIIHQRELLYKGAGRADHLLQKQTIAKKSVAFWSGYVDGPMMSSMYSVYVLLVLLIVTLTATYDPYGGFTVNQIMGYVGIANLGALIVIVIIFKLFLIQYMTNTAKSLKVEGYSEFNMVYQKTKELNSVDLSELHKIEQIIESNPIDFRRCFPNANLNATLKSVKETIAVKIHQKNSARIRNVEQQVEYQKLSLQLNRSTVALASWRSLVKEKLFLLTPLAIVIYILWGQCIATTLYGVTVCGYLTVANLSLITLIILFYNLFYRRHLEDKISECKARMKILQTREAVTFKI